MVNSPLDSHDFSGFHLKPIEPPHDQLNSKGAFNCRFLLRLREFAGGCQVFFSYPPWNEQFAPKNGWLEDEICFGMAYFQGLC